MERRDDPVWHACGRRTRDERPANCVTMPVWLRYPRTLARTSEGSMKGNAARTRLQWVGLIMLVLLAMAGCRKSAAPVNEARPVHTVQVTLAPDDQESSYTGDVR